MADKAPYKRKPHWLKKMIPDPHAMNRMRGLLSGLKLNTICEEANCPNIGECWSQRTATFLILGDICTRRCGFCDVTTGQPHCTDPEEPDSVAEAVEALGLRHVVITSVARDDLADGGADHFARVIQAVRGRCPTTTVEVLIPDFDGDEKALDTVLEAGPDILGHNVETVPRLHRKVRPRFRYERSVQVLGQARASQPEIFTKSSVMLGLGETEDEIVQVMKDLRAVDCTFFTIGQYLRPSKDHLPVEAFIAPETFQRLKQIGEDLGFGYVASGPFVRSSFDAVAALDAVGYSRQEAPAAGFGGI